MSGWTDGENAMIVRETGNCLSGVDSEVFVQNISMWGSAARYVCMWSISGAGF